MEPDVNIYPLAMAPPQKTLLILNSFHFHSFFLGWFFYGGFFTKLGPFWTDAGGKNSSTYDHIKLGPWFHPLTVRLTQKPSLFIGFNGFYWFSPSCGLFCSFCSYWVPTKPLQALWRFCGGPRMTPEGAKPLQISPPQLQNLGTPQKYE